MCNNLNQTSIIIKGGKYMNTERENLQKTRQLLLELQAYEDALDVCKNYDRQILAKFRTVHNHNSSYGKSVELRLPIDIQKSILDWVNEEIKKIKQELEKV